MNSWITESELTALQLSGLHTETPFIIQRVSYTQFSISRYSGGCRYNGREYTYNPQTDELIRTDVVAWIAKRRRDEKKRLAASAREKQGRLF